MMAFRGGAGVAGALFAGMASSALTLVIARGAVAISRCLSFCIATGAAFVCSRGGCWVSCGVRPVADRGAVSVAILRTADAALVSGDGGAAAGPGQPREARGDAGEALGDSIYEARIYVRGDIASLGADCVAKEMRSEHHKELEYLLKAAGFEGDDTAAYTRYGSARNLYHFHVDNASSY